MRLIICTDENNGMLFNNRRQSRDGVLCRYILDTAGETPLVMTEYSAKIFPQSDNIVVSDDIFGCKNCFCFAEEAVPSLEGVQELYWFNWNRRYPADTVFNHNVESLGFVLTETYEFKGSSHDKITLNRYKKGETE